MRLGCQLAFKPIFWFASSIFPIAIVHSDTLEGSDSINANTSQIAISAVGDVIPHLAIKKSARLFGATSNFFYGTGFETLKPILQNTDLAFANLETPLSDKHYNTPKEFVFHADANLARALYWAGFNLLSIANNHSLDQTLLGLEETIKFGQKENIPMIGAGLTRAASEGGYCALINSLRVCSVGFTQVAVDTWAQALNKKRAWINYNYRPEEVVTVLKNLRPRSDVLIVSIHWGTEYKSQANLEQIRLGKKMIAAGADLILGHHPHVLQQIEVVENPQTKRKALIAYSLGNFLSNQAQNFTSQSTQHEKGRPRDSMILSTVFDKQGLKDFKVTPLWTFHEKKPNGIYITTKSIDGELERLKNERDELMKYVRTETPEPTGVVAKHKQQIKRLSEEIAFFETRKMLILKTVFPENSITPLADKKAKKRIPSSD